MNLLYINNLYNISKKDKINARMADAKNIKVVNILSAEKRLKR